VNSLDGIFSIGMALVGVALVTTIVIHPASANVIKAMGTSFATATRAAIGK
jgi:hypothetical protein